MTNSLEPRPKGMNDLPTELIQKIIDLIYHKQAECPPLPNAYKVLYALCLVNQRIGAIALSVMRHTLCLTTENFADTVEYYSAEHRLEQARLVRRIFVGPCPESMYNNSPRARDNRFLSIRPEEALSQVQPFNLANLTSFQSPSIFCSPAVFAALGGCSQLQYLTAAWNVREGWPNLQNLRHLHSLRLFIHRHAWYPIRPSAATLRLGMAVVSYASITTLALHDACSRFDHPRQLVPRILSRLDFPQLRVLALHNVREDIVDVFNFVNRHPTLREVNVSTEDLEIRLEAVLTLLDGTGPWPGTLPVRRGIPKNEISPPVRPDFTSDVKVDAFAFMRCPLDAESERWDGTVGSPKPRYRCTALSMDLRTQWADGALSSVVGDLAPYIPDVEELRLSLALHWGAETILHFVKALCAALQDAFPRLSTLAVRCAEQDKDPLYYDSQCHFTWGRPDDREFKRHGPVARLYLPFLDYSHPFVCLSSDYDIDECRDSNGKPDDVWDVPPEMLAGPDSVKAAIRSLVGADEDTPLDYGDHGLLKRAWEERNKAFFAWMVRTMVARSCPSLIAFEWWPAYVNICARWQWAIERGRGPIAVSGKLDWDPPLMFGLVGQELEEACRR